MCGNCGLRSTICEYGRHPSSNRRDHAKTSYPTPPASLDETTSGKTRFEPANGTRQPSSDLEKIPFASEATLGLDVFATSIASLTRSHAFTKTSTNTLPYLLHHFTSSGFATLSSNTGQKVLKDQVPGLATQFPFLLDTILAFSANHVTYLEQKQGIKASAKKEMSVTATWHTLRALNGYGRTLSEYHDEIVAIGPIDNGGWVPRSQSGPKTKQDQRQELDALVAACIMLTSLFYHVVDTDEKSRVWSSKWIPDETEDAISATKSVNDHTGGPGSLGDVLKTPFPDNGPPLVFLDAGHSSLHEAASKNSSTKHWAKPKCDWVTNMTGLSILLSLTPFQEHLPYSIWFPFFAEANDRDRNGTVGINVSHLQVPEFVAGNGREGRPSCGRYPPDSSTGPCDFVNPPLACPEPERLPHLHTLMSLDPQHHIICAPLVAHLMSLLALSPANLDNFSQIISFPGRFSPGLPPLVANRHVVALLIIGYWFGLVEGIPHWWSRERGRTEGLAIQDWLVNMVKTMAKMAKGWGALRETEDVRQWREGTARAVEEFVEWRKERSLG